MYYAPRIFEDIEPFERRKLWLLNGEHSLLAYAGPLYGHATVAQAVGDRCMRGWIDALWDEASGHLPDQLLQLDAYRSALLQRFSNARIWHELAQIADDGLTKLQVRIVPVALAEREQGRDAQAAARAVAAWVATWLQREPLNDAHADAIKKARDASGDPALNLVSLLSDPLARDADFMRTVRQTLDSLPSPQEPAA